MMGIHPKTLKDPQPLTRPGRWEAAVLGPCTKKCHNSVELVTELHEQEYTWVKPVPKFYVAWSTTCSAQLVRY
jgi:hypothetical protein